RSEFFFFDFFAYVWAARFWRGFTFSSQLQDSISPTSCNRLKQRDSTTLACTCDPRCKQLIHQRAGSLDLNPSHTSSTKPLKSSSVAVGQQTAVVAVGQFNINLRAYLRFTLGSSTCG